MIYNKVPHKCLTFEAEMQKAASVASALVLFFPPTVLIFGLYTRKTCLSRMLCCANFLPVYSCADLSWCMHKIELPAQLFACAAVHSCANFWAIQTKLAQLE